MCNNDDILNDEVFEVSHEIASIYNELAAAYENRAWATKSILEEVSKLNESEKAITRLVGRLRAVPLWGFVDSELRKYVPGAGWFHDHEAPVAAVTVSEDDEGTDAQVQADIQRLREKLSVPPPPELIRGLQERMRDFPMQENPR